MTEVERRAGLGRDEDLRRTVRATLDALAGVLTADEATLIRSVVPIANGAGPQALESDLANLWAKIASAARVPLAFAREHAPIAIHVIGERLHPDARLRLSRGLSPSLAALLEPQEPESPPAEGSIWGHVHDRHGSSIATGRPGSAHPLSESAPPGAHAESVVRSANPHGSSKLSSAEGLTQQREGHALADARPEENRSIARARLRRVD